MRAIWFEENSSKLIDIRLGESNFKVIDDFWFDWKPDGGEKTTAFCPNLVPDTENNRAVIQEIKKNRADKKKIVDEFDKQMYQIRNKLSKWTDANTEQAENRFKR